MKNKDQKVINAAFQEAVGQILAHYARQIDFYSLMFAPKPSDGIINKDYLASSFTDELLRVINAQIDADMLDLLNETTSLTYNIDLDAFSCGKNR